MRKNLVIGMNLGPADGLPPFCHAAACTYGQLCSSNDPGARGPAAGEAVSHQRN
jgi:hypothetical protein